MCYNWPALLKARRNLPVPDSWGADRLEGSRPRAGYNQRKQYNARVFVLSSGSRLRSL